MDEELLARLDADDEVQRTDDRPFSDEQQTPLSGSVGTELLRPRTNVRTARHLAWVMGSRAGKAKARGQIAEPRGDLDVSVKAPDKRRPVVILSRQEVIPLLDTVMVAPMTSTRRGAPARSISDLTKN